MFNFPHSHQHPLAMPVSGSDVRSRSKVGAVVVLTLVASLVGVGMSFGVTADSATAGLPVEAHGGHQHAAMAGLNAAGVISGSPVSAVREDLATARSATAAFHRVPAAEAAGFGRLPAGAPLHECIDEDVDLDDTDGAPAMGVHWVNGGRLDATLSPDSPEVLVYEPQADGTLDLVAVEYVVFESAWDGEQPPELFGQSFHHVPAPNRYGLPSFYALHAWLWQANPAGLFANMNPAVTCTNASAVG